MKKISAILVLMLISSTVFAGTCKPFVMEVQASESTATFEYFCASEVTSIASLGVSYGGKTVKVDSGTLSLPQIDVKTSIIRRITEGFNSNDAQIIFNRINPALQRGDLVEARLALIDLVNSER